MRRGYGLAFVLTFGSVLFILAMTLLMQIDYAERQLLDHNYLLQAHSLADSGCRYAKTMVGQGRWQKTTRYQAPDFPEGTFRVTAEKLSGRWQFRCRARSGWREVEKVEVAPP